MASRKQLESDIKKAIFIVNDLVTQYQLIDSTTKASAEVARSVESTESYEDKMFYEVR